MRTEIGKRLADALKKASTIGIIEEDLDIENSVITIQTLPSEEYGHIVSDLEEVPEAHYMHEFYMRHVARALVGVDGTSLKDVDFVETEVPSGAYLVVAQVGSDKRAQALKDVLKKEGVKAQIVPPDPEEVRTIKVPRHEWVLDNVVRGWSNEVLTVVAQKFLELRETAEKRARSTVKFSTPSETPEEKFRRLLIELQEVSDNIPPQLRDSIIKAEGLAGSVMDSQPQEALVPLDDKVINDKTVPQPASTGPRRRTLEDLVASNQEDGESGSEDALIRQAAIQARERLRSQAQQPPQQPQLEIPPEFAVPEPSSIPAHLRAEPIPGEDFTPPAQQPQQPPRTSLVPPHLREVAQRNSQMMSRTDVTAGGIPVLETQAAKPTARLVDSAPVGGINPRFRNPKLP